MAKVPDTPENMARCICGGCPSYPSEEVSSAPKARAPKR